MHTNKHTETSPARPWARRWRQGGAAAAWLALAALLPGCWEDTGLNPEDAAKQAAQPPAVQPAAGGTVEVTQGAAAGTKVVVPADAVVEGENITLSVSDTLPGALPAEALTAGAVAVSKVLSLERTGVVDFGKTVNVTLPIDKATLPADAVPVVVYWDESIQAYSPIAVKSVDYTNGKLTFMTAHASKFAVMWVKFGAAGTVLDTTKLSVALDFSPAVDGFFVHNFGSYEEPGGNAFGMAAYAGWYHRAQKVKKGAPGLATLYKEGNPALEEDDQVARELIARAYQAGSQKAHIAALDNAAAAAALGSTALAQQNVAALTLVQQLVLTRQAQVLAMGTRAANGTWTDGHAVTVYAYDGAAQRFLLYDNNYPGEEVTLPWNPSTGFGKDSKNRSFSVFAFAAFNSAYSSNTLESLYQAAQAGFPTSLYPKITIASPSETRLGSNTYEVAADAVVTVAGTVPRPTSATSTAPRYAHVYLNGVRMAAPTAVDAGGNFNIAIGTLPSASGTDVMVLVSETDKAYAGWGSGAAWAGGFHAYKQFKLRVANQYFFQNMGFETGDLTGWASERHLWGSPTPQVVPSDKSAVVSTAGFDPIAADLQVPLFGKHAFRVNNEDNNEHISSLTQTAVVPTSKNPVLRFYWSAVLEDPNHSPEDQPYIEIVVTNTTKNIELYRKRYFANDPTYSGWKAYQSGRWVSIPWQLVELPVAQYAGDNITLRVEAADCALGGHGGYGYIDVDE